MKGSSLETAPSFPFPQKPQSKNKIVHTLGVLFIHNNPIIFKPFCEYGDIHDFCRAHHISINEAYHILLKELQKTEP